MAPLDACIHSQQDARLSKLVKGQFIMFGVSPWHRWLPAFTGTKMLACSSTLVKGSREHSRDAKVVGLVEHAEFMKAEDLGGAVCSL